MVRRREILRIAQIGLGRSGFALFVACAILVAPVGAQGLTSQRGAQGELNEERTELTGSEQSRSGLHQVTRSVSGKRLAGACTGKNQIRIDVVAALRRSVAKTLGALPSVEGWRSPLRC